jgi:hypothetical protein
MKFYYFLLGLVVSGFFFYEAKKRGQQPFLWFSVGFTAYFLPFVVIVGIFSSDIAALMTQYKNTKVLIGVFTLIIHFAASVVLIIMGYQQLIKYASKEERSAQIHINSLDIIETKDGEYSVGEKVFKTRRDAEDFVALLKGLS